MILFFKHKLDETAGSQKSYKVNYSEMALNLAGRLYKNHFAAKQHWTWNAEQQQKFAETKNKPHGGHQTLPIFTYQGHTIKDVRLHRMVPEFWLLLYKMCWGDTLLYLAVFRIAAISAAAAAWQSEESM